jgi:hypothetical protein
LSDREIDVLLERLVAQFASPYDFLRELVQNAMDAGSDVADVTLHTHAGEGDAVVLEIEVVDAGEGMDEAIIDGELTRLFASSKAGDRTMAGGFGIGFVSVFAWDPEVVLLHTGRRDEAWELVFARDRTFEKHPVEERVEGTTLRLYRRGRAAEREAIAEAIRDSLWRWCRFCPIDVTFEDVEAGTGRELIRDAPLPEDAIVQLEHIEAESTFRLAFAPVPHVVLLRHGLVLGEGSAGEHLPHLAPLLGRTTEHLRLWLDSPRLRTSLARDRVVDDAGREALERDVAKLLDRLRADLLAKVEQAAAAPQWDAARHDAFAFAHAHLAVEREHLKSTLASRPVLRSVGGAAISPAALRDRSKAAVVAVVAPGDPATPDEAGLRVAAVAAGVPVIVARWPDDRPWLEPLLALVQLRALPLHRAVSRVEDDPSGAALGAIVHAVLVRAELEIAAVRMGRFVDAPPSSACALDLGRGAALHGVPLPASLLRGATLWLDTRHHAVSEALALYPAQARLAALALAELVALHIAAEESMVEDVAEAWAEVR